MCFKFKLCKVGTTYSFYDELSYYYVKCRMRRYIFIKPSTSNPCVLICQMILRVVLADAVIIHIYASTCKFFVAPFVSPQMHHSTYSQDKVLNTVHVRWKLKATNDVNLVIGFNREAKPQIGLCLKPM